MKRKFCALLLSFFLLIRFSQTFAQFWAQHMSLPILRNAENVGTSIPFPILEWASLAIAAYLIAGLMKKHFFKRISALLLAFVCAYLTIWYPLYFQSNPTPFADDRKLTLLCEALIDDLNAADLSFELPEDLPAKTALFPIWMDAFGIYGFCSFFTGEALIYPQLSSESKPFVAVHEAVHLRGFAGEGTANIAAWEECMQRGGAYALSAKLWALRYGMSLLYQIIPSYTDNLMLRMNAQTLRAYHAIGGGTLPTSLGRFSQRIYAAMGIETYMQDYEILAHYLAAQYVE